MLYDYGLRTKYAVYLLYILQSINTMNLFFSDFFLSVVMTVAVHQTNGIALLT